MDRLKERQHYLKLLKLMGKKETPGALDSANDSDDGKGLGREAHLKRMTRMANKFDYYNSEKDKGRKRRVVE